MDGAFLTEEDTYDALVLRNYYLDRFDGLKELTPEYGVRLKSIRQRGSVYEVCYIDRNGTEKTVETGYVLNAAYASCNQVLKLVEEMILNQKALWDQI